MARSLARNTQLFATTLDINTGADAVGSCDDKNTFELKVLDGYSFSQDVATQEVGVNESDSSCSGSGLARGTLSFNTALNPVDVSFSTYVRPYTNANDIAGDANAFADCTERVLWSSAMGDKASWNIVTGTEGASAAAPAASQVIEAQTAALIKFGLGASNTNSLMDLTLFFVLEQTTYKILDFNVTTAEVDFSIDGIATINWSGQGSRVLEDEAVHTAVASWTAGTDYLGVPTTTTDTFLRNKLSVLEISDNAVYGVDLTATADESDGVASATGGVITLDTTITDDTYVAGIVHNTGTNEWAFVKANNTTTVTVSDVYADMVDTWLSSHALGFYTTAQDDVDSYASNVSNVITLTSTITDLVYAGGRIVNIETGEWATVTSNNTTTVTVASADTALVTTWTNLDVIAMYTSAQAAGVTYCVPITGATLSLENNMTYLTPEELAIVNLPLAGFAGNRVTSGSFTAYLNTGAQGTGGLLQDMLAKIQTSVSNNYRIKFKMGGTSTPRVEFDVAHANLSVPTTNVEDLITTEISFSAKPWDTTNQEASFEDTNELTITYYDKA